MMKPEFEGAVEFRRDTNKPEFEEPVFVSSFSDQKVQTSGFNSRNEEFSGHPYQEHEHLVPA